MKTDNIEKHSRIVLVRFTPSEYATLAAIQRKTHYNMSRFIRTVLLEKSPNILDKETAKNYKEILKFVQYISNNVNQIAKAHNALLKTKPNMTEKNKEVIKQTIEIMQLWDSNKSRLLQVPHVPKHEK
ncbi:hypothetical protein FACS1894199_02730 [Bacteroidia bacterium]|nr:hypothetical protein FACS1894199_02730 [Bacteroidia bacterium]